MHSTEAADRSSPSQKLILHVDDDEGMRLALDMTLSLEGFKTASFASAPAASAALDSCRPDLIITDLVMPGQGGTSFLRGLRATVHEKTPVFVFSGLILDEAILGIIRQEANIVEFLTKPLRTHTLLAAIHKHLNTAA